MATRMREVEPLVYLTAQVTFKAMQILRAEAARRRRIEAARVPYGKILSEMLLEYDRSALDSGKPSTPTKATKQLPLSRAAG